jgi:hypothetical protein
MFHFTYGKSSMRISKKFMLIMGNFGIMFLLVVCNKIIYSQKVSLSG